jgi:hypothetical protein
MKEVGSTEGFVLAQGFVPVRGQTALVRPDGGRRMLAELTADPDRPEVRPPEAYRTLLSAMQPGWTVRILQIFWPDSRPRLAFHAQVERWGGGEGQGEGLALLRQGLQLHLQEASLPFARRTILEFSLPGEEGLAWWEGLPGLLAAYGIHVQPLSETAIAGLARQIFNPELE